MNLGRRLRYITFVAAATLASPTLRTHAQPVDATRATAREWLHVLDGQDRLLSLPPLGARVMSASMLNGGAPVDVVTSDAGATLTLPRSTSDDPDRVIVVVTRGQTEGKN